DGLTLPPHRNSAMDLPTTATLTLCERLERLERENRRLALETRRLRALLAAGFLSVLGLFAAGAAYVERTELRTDHLVLLDKFGQPRVDLGVDIDGKAALQFLDKDQKPRLSISSRPEGSPVVEMGDQLGNVRAALAVDAFGPPSLNLADQNGKVRFSA